MKIISWNCNMAFRKKFEKITQLNPDLLVIQECENDEKLKTHLSSVKYNQLLWYGNNPNKGIAILSFNDTHIELREDHNPEYEYIIPITLKVKSIKLNLFCIWAMPHKTERQKRYIGQIWGAVNHYYKCLQTDSILIGDFNSNAIWDEIKRIGNHTDVVNFLAKKNIHSIYHRQFNCNHGEETDPTLFLQKNFEKQYHIDYCFLSRGLLTEKTTIEIGKYNNWIKLSDHMPIIINHVNLYSPK